MTFSKEVKGKNPFQLLIGSEQMSARSHTSSLTAPWKPVQVNCYPLQKSVSITCRRMAEMLPGLPSAAKQCDLMTFAGSYMHRKERPGLPSEIIKIKNEDIIRVKKRLKQGVKTYAAAFQKSSTLAFHISAIIFQSASPVQARENFLWTPENRFKIHKVS